MKESDYTKGLAKYLVKSDRYLALNIEQARELVRLVRKYEDKVGMLPPGIYVPCGPYETVEYVWEDEDEKK